MLITRHHLPSPEERFSEDSESCAIFPVITASRIKEFRMQKGMTQEEFANKYGINVRTLKRWEGDRAKPRLTETFRKILADLGLSKTSKRSRA